jgi:hypothetical protein
VILPTKHIRPEDSLLNVAGLLLSALPAPKTPSQVWDRVRLDERISTYQRFVAGLDLLFMMGLVELRAGQLRRVP